MKKKVNNPENEENEYVLHGALKNGFLIQLNG